MALGNGFSGKRHEPTPRAVAIHNMCADRCKSGAITAVDLSSYTIQVIAKILIWPQSFLWGTRYMNSYNGYCILCRGFRIWIDHTRLFQPPTTIRVTN